MSAYAYVHNACVYLLSIICYGIRCTGGDEFIRRGSRSSETSVRTLTLYMIVCFSSAEKSPGIFSRLFGSRRSTSKSRKSNSSYCCATQFPPDEWFNRGVQPQQSTSTQTEKVTHYNAAVRKCFTTALHNYTVISDVLQK
jgi:hypothetical protein